MEDIEYMSEEEAQLEIDNTMSDPKHPYHDKLHLRHGDAVRRMTKLYEAVYPEPDEPDGEQPAERPDFELVEAMKEGLEIAKKKAVEREEQANERLDELLDLIDENKLSELAGEIKSDLIDMGAETRDLQLVDYLQEIVSHGDNAELKSWCMDLISWIYAENKKKGGRK